MTRYHHVMQCDDIRYHHVMQCDVIRYHPVMQCDVIQSYVRDQSWTQGALTDREF